MKDKILKIAGVKSEAAFYKKFPTEAAFKKAHGKEFKKAQLGASISPEIGGAKYGKQIKKAQFGENDLNLNKPTGGVMTGMQTPKIDQWGNPLPLEGTKSSTPANPYAPLPMYDQSQMGTVAEQAAASSNAVKINSGTTNTNTNKNPNKSINYNNLQKGFEATSTLGKNIQKVSGAIKAKKEAKQLNKVAPIVLQAANTRPEEIRRRYVRPEDMAFGTQEMGSAYGTGTNYLSRNGSVIGGNPTEIQNTYAPNNTLYDDLGYEPLEDSDQVKQYRRGGLVKAQAGEILAVANEATNLLGDITSGIIGIGTNKLNKQNEAMLGQAAFHQGAQDLQQGQFNAYMEYGGEMSYAQDGATSTNWVCPPGYTKYQTSDGSFECLHTNPVPGSSIASKKDLKTIQEDIQYSPNNPDFASILQSSLDESVKIPSAYFKDPKTGRLIVGSPSAQYIKQPDLAKTTAQVVTRENGGWMNPEYNPQVIAKFGDHTAQDYYNAGHEGMDSLRAGGHLTNYTPPSERAMQTYALGGELKTLWGGHAEPISQNPYLPGTGETVMFKGQSHDDGGIGVSYGNKGQDSYTDYAEYGTEAAMDNADVEVEGGEPMVELEEGGQIDPMTGEAQKAGVVYGNLVLNKQLAEDHSLGKEAGRKMKHIVKDWSKGEAKQNKIIDKSLKMIDDADDSTAFGQLAFSTAKAMNQGANMKLKKYADDKIKLAGIQSALNDTAKEHGVVADDLARGKIKIDKSNNDMAKFGASLVNAKDGIKKKKGTTKKKDVEKLNPFKLTTFESMKPGYLSPLDIPEGYDEARAKDAEDAAARAAWKVDPRHDSPYMGLEKESKAPWSGRPSSEPINYNPKKSDWKDTAMMAYNEVSPWLRPNYKVAQPDFSSEMLAASMNQMEPVQAQSINPYLTQDYDVSFQDQLNANQADFNALQRLTGYNPAASSALAAQKYAANSKILGEQFRTNQGERARVSEKNRDIMSQTDLTNLGIYDKQYERQATAKSKTKTQAIEIAKSISDKLAQQRKEQAMSNIEQQRYNFRFDANGRPINMNPLATFNMYGSGKNQQAAPPEGYEYRYNSKQEPVDIVKSKKDSTGKNGSKIKARNGSIVKAIKNL